MNRSTFWTIKYMNGSVFSKARYKNGVGFKILDCTPIPQLPLSYTLENVSHLWSSVQPSFGSSQSGPSCSKLTTSLVNDLLKFTSSDVQIC